jgi:hypothetical protein
MRRRFAYGGGSVAAMAILPAVALWSSAAATGSKPNARRLSASAASAAGAQQSARSFRAADGRVIERVSDRNLATKRSTTTHACRTSQLTIRMGHSQAGGGTAGADIEFINRSKHVCDLRGWPTLTAEIAARSSALAHDWPAADFAGFAAGGISARVGVPTVILVPNRRADAVFAAADGPGIRPCGRPYRTLHVTPPGSTESVAISAWIWYLGRFLPSCSQIRLSPVLPSTDLYKG